MALSRSAGPSVQTVSKSYPRTSAASVEQPASGGDRIADLAAHSDRLRTLPGKRKAVPDMLFLVHSRWGRGQLLNDLFVQPGRGVLGRHREGIFDRPFARAAVADDANAVDPQQRGPAIGTVVVFMNQGSQDRMGLVPFHVEGFAQLVCHHFHHELEQPFAHFEHHVADKAFGDHHVAGPAVDVTAFNVTDELVMQRAVVK